MTLKLWLGLCAALVLLCHDAGAEAAGKIGVVDVEAILTALPERAAVESTLKLKLATLQKDVDGRWAEVARLSAELKEMQTAGGNKEGIAQSQENIIKKETELSAYWNSMADRIRAETELMSVELSGAVEQAITRFAKDNSYQLMFDSKSGKLIYAAEGLDCTDAALKVVLAGSDPKLKPSAPSLLIDPLP